MGCLLLVISCKGEADTNFKSDFANIKKHAVIGSKYEANSIQEWQISNNRMECLVSKENRNIRLLTRQLSEQKGDLEMRVRLGFFNDKISTLNKNWAGFSIGLKEQFNDHRDNVIFAKSLNIGVCTNGALFIGAPSPNHKNEKVIEKLSKGVDLVLTVIPIGNTYTLYVSIYDIETRILLSKISKKEVTSDQLIGDLVLVSNFENLKDDKDNNTKSVWFKNWGISGSKIITRSKKSVNNN
ncbi:hypothetical protein [Flavivirga spongiicola]|uniref:Lipoprotein n=1 Tax=Flavivirga spongiicola TaxID=421621 RepID=A0ABU7XXL5_9FLAO|nr:hypothetical protein [Flavivirga sp. MEBiC05379]MDO5980175.1 hypothetical protein [Flavivirga sp. MEBiC05379]